ncbi:MAG TPA: tripartite tricarboxylate transporter substrate binding protein [Burkholderiales bacterium]|nr:tripartite tricarboxylate transporter substrate binding protein [Burkholderiales bacterium]
MQHHIAARHAPRRISMVALCAAALALAAPLAPAADAPYPNRAIRLVLPFPAGGGTDNLARIMGPKMLALLGQPVVIDNKPGAAGNIATDNVAKAEPDGYTVLMGFNTALTINPALYKNLSFDIGRDLRPVTLLAGAQYILTVNSSVPAKSVKELIALARAKPGSLNYSSSGPGGPLHLAAELFKARTGTDIIHVPYKGGGPASVALIGGDVQMMFGSVTAVLPFIREGKLRGLASSGMKRLAVAPEIPTLNESGLPGFNVTSWYGLLVPAKTPDAVVAKLGEAAQKTVQMPEVREAMSRQGLDVATDTPAQFASLIKEESKTWADLIAKLNIKAD